MSLKSVEENSACMVNRQEEEDNSILSEQEKKQEWMKQLSLLRNKANHQHNMKIKKDQIVEIILAWKPLG